MSHFSGANFFNFFNVYFEKQLDMFSDKVGRTKPAKQGAIKIQSKYYSSKDKRQFRTKRVLPLTLRNQVVRPFVL